MTAGRHHECLEAYSSQIAAEAVHAGVEHGFRHALVAQQMKRGTLDGCGSRDCHGNHSRANEKHNA
jgi:hypothetical protein